MDIGTLLETHRRYMVDLLDATKPELEDTTLPLGLGLNNTLMIMHDRATTKTLLDMYRDPQPAPNPQQITLERPQIQVPNNAAPSRKIKPGSKKAKERALKAQQTRRDNLARKAQEAKWDKTHSGTDVRDAVGQPMNTEAGGGEAA